MADMNCEQVREQLELLFGQDELPEEVERHLEGCDACRSHLRELQRLSQQLGADTDFEPSPDDLLRAVAGVEERIKPEEATSIVSVSWLRSLTRVAAAVLIVGMAYTSYMIGRNQAGQPAEIITDTVVTTASADSLEMEDYFVSMLIEDYSSDASFEASSMLLDDITEEEMEYLTENLTVGDLL
jgi:hypothetical protein